MHFLLPILAIVAGLLAASSIVIKKLPNAADVVQKLKPYEAFIGAGTMIMGFLMLFSLGREFRIGLIGGSAAAACVGACILMGFLLGYPVLQDMLLDELSEDARKKSEELYEKLTPYKVTAGLVAMGSGVYLLIFQ